MSLADLTAIEAAGKIAAGEIRSAALVEACLERVDRAEAEVRAWAYLDRDYALDQARKADAAREAGMPLGPLHGVPVGIKDIFDTADMPTEFGTPLEAGRRPKRDAAVVSQLRAAGAVIMGKTVTTELAVYTPNETRNPHDPARTPGGSSSGSAAAVAARMVPLAVGTQTNGSIIRPASYCGVVGYKPTLGRVSRRGILPQSRHLDHVGVFAATVEDAALIADSIAAYDDRDPDMAPSGRVKLADVALAEPPVPPMFAFVKSPAWGAAADDTREAFAEIADFLGDQCDEVNLPEAFDRAVDYHRTIHLADMARNYASFYERGGDRLSDPLRGQIEEGRTVRAVDYTAALDLRAVLEAGLDEVFERYDAILTPATTGEAPVGLDSTGSPVFCTLWTYVGAPAVSLPLLQGASGMPLGVQLVGPRGDDARLLRTARWLVRAVESGDLDDRDGGGENGERGTQ